MKRPSRNLLYPNANAPRYSATTIGHVLSPEHQRILDRVRQEQIRRLEERRKDRG